MKQLEKVFRYGNGRVRTIIQDKEPWFIASDVCRILGISNATQAVQKLDSDERSMFNLGRQGKANIVNEFGLYNLILGSRKTGARAFKRWVTHEVLPSIRKTGRYAEAVAYDPEWQRHALDQALVENAQLRKWLAEYDTLFDGPIAKAKGLRKNYAFSLAAGGAYLGAEE